VVYSFNRTQLAILEVFVSNYWHNGAAALSDNDVMRVI